MERLTDFYKAEVGPRIDKLLRRGEEIHQRFTELSVEGAEASEVIAQAAALAGAPVVLVPAQTSVFPSQGRAFIEQQGPVPKKAYSSRDGSK